MAIHFVPFNIMGTVVSVPSYASGDHVNYGGMIYQPEGEVVSGALRMVYRPWAEKGLQSAVYHEAWLSWYDGKPMFYCS